MPFYAVILNSKCLFCYRFFQLYLAFLKISFIVKMCTISNFLYTFYQRVVLVFFLRVPQRETTPQGKKTTFWRKALIPKTAQNKKLNNIQPYKYVCYTSQGINSAVFLQSSKYYVRCQSSYVLIPLFSSLIMTCSISTAAFVPENPKHSADFICSSVLTETQVSQPVARITASTLSYKDYIVRTPVLWPQHAEALAHSWLRRVSLAQFPT